MLSTKSRCHGSGRDDCALRQIVSCAKEDPPDDAGDQGPNIAKKAFPDCKTIVLYDNESASKINRIVSKLVDAYCTLEHSQQSYNPITLPILATRAIYLHPSASPRNRLLRDMGWTKRNYFCFDCAPGNSSMMLESGLSLKLKRQLISTLSKRGQW